MGLATNGKMTKKLLYKTQFAYLIFSAIVLVTAIPLFYYFNQNLFTKEIDKTLKLHKREFMKQNMPLLKISEIPLWNKYNSYIKILSPSKKHQMGLQNSFYVSKSKMERLLPYREFKAKIIIEGKPYVYQSKINLIQNEDLLETSMVLFVTILSILLIGLFIITKWLTQKLWKPFYNTLALIEEFEIDKTKAINFDNNNIEEFNKLNNAINKLIIKNIAIYKNQREFVENAAHELQTPLAIFQAKIETLIQRNDITLGQSQILSTLGESATRLNRLNKNLLLLSKIENEHFADKQNISVNEILERNFSFFEEQASQKKITIKTDLQCNLNVQASPELMEIMLNNLFKNAIAYNNIGGLVEINIQNNSIQFRNTGQDYELNKEKLFSRFSKEISNNKGNGLGLAIIKKISKVNDWEVDYSFLEKKHIFCVKF
jgi:signal transduction histidine kinase